MEKTYLPTVKQIGYWAHSKKLKNVLLEFEINIQQMSVPRIELAVSKLIEKWEILRTVYRQDETGLVYCHVLNKDSDLFKVSYVITKNIQQEIENKRNYNENILISEGPLISFYIFDDGNSRLFKLYINHVHCAGISYRILIDELTSFYVNPQKDWGNDHYQFDKYAKYENEDLIKNYSSLISFSKENFKKRDKTPFFNYTELRIDLTSIENLLREFSLSQETPQSQYFLSESALQYHSLFYIGDLGNFNTKLGISLLGIIVSAYANCMSKFFHHLELLIILLEKRKSKYAIKTIGDLCGEVFYELDGSICNTDIEELKSITNKIYKLSENIISNRYIYFSNERDVQEKLCGYINFEISDVKFSNFERKIEVFEEVDYKQSMLLETYSTLYQNGYIMSKWRFRDDKVKKETIKAVSEYFKREVMKTFDLIKLV
ncbi:condensation domain-containing protein [Croceitalea marina]|uniref:Condensation domain-containing protein n=1 Tax=Croceitalea marina TaxID=1775166 RepID=A0ABW5MYT9_9FLAO